MQALPRFDDPNVLVGPEHFSDAGVYRLNEQTVIVQTLDFFAPVVDDPYTYGQIAAANSLSDVYAMGGQPKTALSIVGFPDDKLELEVLQTILRGGAERVAKAGAVILGGHSVRDAEIKFGLSVTGVVDPQKILTNAAAKPGDALVLTKALGTGFITTAHRQDQCPDEALHAACASMVQLNQSAAQAALHVAARAATDVTGFGLVGHGLEMAQASEATLHIDLSSLPMLPGARELAAKGHHTRANAANRAHAKNKMRFECDENHPDVEFLFDPQTSGGLLIAVAAERAGELVTRCHDASAAHTAVIGEVVAREQARLVID